MRAEVDRAGGDGSAFAVLGSLATPRRQDNSLDVEAMTERLSPLVDLGVTDFLAHGRAPRSCDEAEVTYAELVTAFTKATER